MQLYHRLFAPACQHSPLPSSLLPPDAPSLAARSIKSFHALPCSAANCRAVEGSAGPRMGNRWKQGSSFGLGGGRGEGGGDSFAGRSPSPGWWEGDAGIVASRRGSAEAKRGGHTAMSEEQVSRCHTHSGVAESTMCVSQWLTCSWRVTGGGGRRGPPAAQETPGSMKDGGRGAEGCSSAHPPPGHAPSCLPRGRRHPAVPGVGILSFRHGRRSPALPPLRAPPAAAAANFSLCPGPAHAARRGPPLRPLHRARQWRRRPPARQPRPRTAAPNSVSVTARRQRRRGGAGRPPPPVSDSGGRGAFASARRCCGEEPFVPVEPPPASRSPRPADPPPPALASSPHAGGR